MRKHRIVLFKHFSEQLTEVNNHLTLLPGSTEENNRASEELNDILLYVITNSWEKKSYLLPYTLIIISIVLMLGLVILWFNVIYIC